ncbi:RNA polymerase sigma factor [Sedimentibacter sp.]|uniref:RNA polymerase sigma factor n=1 Tax=Sedimentibacter sp. TaxID=1960295 RepID=UPI002896795C|nr:RNA polymerase sigma factor [Sedimentibacter sp.]
MLTIYLSMLDTEQERKKMTDLYEEHKYALLHYAMKIMRDQDMAEDAVHNAFISIIQKKEKYLYLDCRDFRRSAVIIVRNKCIDILRKQKPYSNKSIEELEIFLESNEVPVEEQVIFESEYELIRKYLNIIDEISKQVLLMKYILNMSYKEIGEELGMTSKHVDTRIMRAKEKVRKLVEKDVKYDE